MPLPRKVRPARVEDVARRAGVSTATISRALNGGGPMTEATRERALRAAQALDYHPNGLARGLRCLKTDTIGLVVPDLENPFFPTLVKGVEHAASARGWNVILGNTDEDSEREERLVRTLVERKIDGLILCPAGGSHAYLARYAKRGLPMVAVNRILSTPSLPSVTADSFQGAYAAARHLLERGRTPLGLILGTPGLSTTESRLAGCRQAVRDLGLSEDLLVLAVGYGRMAQGYKAALECLDQDPRPRALFAFNNLMAEAALMAVHALGIRCPEEVSLFGFDDFRSAAALSPPLSVVEQDPEGMGAKAVEILAQVIETGRPSRLHTLLPTRLVIRASCGCSPEAQERG
jgi:LacI family transcriptional regulator